MKRFITLTVLFSLAALSVFASTLNVKMYDNSQIAMVLDGKEYSSYANDITLNGVTPGKHYVEIVQYQYEYRGKKSRKVIYKGSLVIPEGMMVYGVLDRYNRLKIVENRPIATKTSSNARGYYGDAQYNSEKYGRNAYHDRTENRNAEKYSSKTYRSMYEKDFRNLKVAVMNARFESSRKDMVTNALSYNYFTSAQVLELLNLFTFESTRLEIAKQAYASTVDKENYRITYKAFSYDSSIRDLEKYIYRH